MPVDLDVIEAALKSAGFETNRRNPGVVAVGDGVHIQVGNPELPVLWITVWLEAPDSEAPENLAPVAEAFGRRSP